MKTASIDRRHLEVPTQDELEHIRREFVEKIINVYQYIPYNRIIALNMACNSNILQTGNCLSRIHVHGRFYTRILLLSDVKGWISYKSSSLM